MEAVQFAFLNLQWPICNRNMQAKCDQILTRSDDFQSRLIVPWSPTPYSLAYEERCESGDLNPDPFRDWILSLNYTRLQYALDLQLIKKHQEKRYAIASRLVDA
jgi:hypothetical protein